MIGILCGLEGCVMDMSGATEAEIYYLTAVTIEIVSATVIAGLVTLKLLFKFRKHFRYDD